MSDSYENGHSGRRRNTNSQSIRIQHRNRKYLYRGVCVLIYMFFATAVFYWFWHEYVKDHGYGIYVLSNASDLFYTYFPKFLPLDFFNGVFVSSDYLMLKPDVEIYKTFLNKYGLNADECLFIDDRADNIAGAAKAGLKTFQFKGDYNAVISQLTK